MGCEVLDVGGSPAFVCTNIHERCLCGEPAVYLCDARRAFVGYPGLWPCDEPLCAKCAVYLPRRDRHLCPQCSAAIADGKDEAAERERFQAKLAARKAKRHLRIVGAKPARRKCPPKPAPDLSNVVPMHRGEGPT